MVLIAAIAAGIVASRAYRVLRPTPGVWWGAEVFDTSLWLALFLALGVVGIGLLAPRPPWRRLMTRPGFTACLSVIVTLVVLMAEQSLPFAVVVAQAGIATYEPVWAFQHLGDRLGGTATVGVAVAWVSLALSGRWRRRQGWVDRLGVAIGIYWLLYPLMTYLVAFAPDILRTIGM